MACQRPVLSARLSPRTCRIRSRARAVRVRTAADEMESRLAVSSTLRSSQKRSTSTARSRSGSDRSAQQRHPQVRVDRGALIRGTAGDDAVGLLTVGAPASLGQEHAGEDGPGIGTRVVQPRIPAPACVQPGQRLLDEVLGLVRVATGQQEGGPVQMRSPRRGEGQEVHRLTRRLLIMIRCRHTLSTPLPGPDVTPSPNIDLPRSKPHEHSPGSPLDRLMASGSLPLDLQPTPLVASRPGGRPARGRVQCIRADRQA